MKAFKVCFCQLMFVSLLLTALPAGATSISLTGNFSYQTSGNYVVLRADKVSNNSSSGYSGTLRMELWAFSTPYAGGSQSGYQLATYTLGTLNAGYYYSNLSSGSVSYITPPNGTWYYSLIITEWQGSSYVVVAYGNYNNTVCYGSNCSTTQTCTYGISPTTASPSASGGSSTIAVTTSSSSCSNSWTATSNDSWITITSGNSGTGNGTVAYTVASNSSLARTGTMTIGGKTFTVTQASANAYFDTVQKLYIGYYQRPADPGGLIYWADRLDKSGGNLSEIIEAFANSAEAQALYGTIDSSNISAVVNGIYITLFGRPAETGGLNYYSNGFNTGQFTAATIMLNVLSGAQGGDLQSVNNKVTAANLFTMAIDPDLDGKNFQVTYAGNSDVMAARNFLTLYVTSAKVPTQAETTLFIRTNIANPGDLILGSSLGCPSIYDGTYMGQFDYVYYKKEADGNYSPVQGSFRLTITLNCMATASGSTVLQITSANCSDPNFGCQVSGCTPTFGLATLPASPPTPLNPSQAGQGISIIFPNGASITTQNIAGALYVSTDGRTLSNSLDPGIQNNTWVAIGGNFPSSSVPIGGAVTEFTRWNLVRSAL